MADTKYYEQNGKYYTIQPNVVGGTLSALTEVPLSDIRGRMGDKPSNFSFEEALAQMRQNGEVAPLSKLFNQFGGQIQQNPGHQQYGGGQPVYEIGNSGIVVPQNFNYQSPSNLPQNTEFQGYLGQTGQTFNQEAGFSGTPGQLNNLQPTQQTQNQDGQVFRDQNDNFFYNGQHINLDQFHQLGINADFVPRGSTVFLNQAKTGQPQGGGLNNVVKQTLNKLYDAGYVINPNAEIGPNSLDEFLTIASKEIDPYYQTQLKLASESLKRSLGYSQEELLQDEANLERQYGTNLRTLGEQSAESGFALSGRRQLQEQELAQETQRTIDQGRRQLQFGAGSTVGNFAQQFGGTPGFQLPGQTLTGSPRVLPGQASFEKTNQQSPFYELNPDIYSSLVGEQEFSRRGAIKSRASELEQARNLAQTQKRTLTI